MHGPKASYSVSGPRRETDDPDGGDPHVSAGTNGRVLVLDGVVGLGRVARNLDASSRDAAVVVDGVGWRAASDVCETQVPCAVTFDTFPVLEPDLALPV